MKKKATPTKQNFCTSLVFSLNLRPFLYGNPPPRGGHFKPSSFVIWKSPPGGTLNRPFLYGNPPRADGPYAKSTCVFTIHRMEVLKTRNFSQWITKMMKLLQCLASHQRKFFDLDHFSFKRNKTQTASGYKHLLELRNFYKLDVSYVTTHIIRSDYYSVADKFKFKNTTVRTGN